jgi:pre-mRNA-splicing factor CWC26
MTRSFVLTNTLPAQTVNTLSTEFRKKKSQSWTTIGNPTPTNTEQATADAIILAAAAETRAHNEAEDDAPIIAGDDSTPSSFAAAAAAAAATPRPGGLQTGPEVRAAAERKRTDEQRKMAAEVSAMGGGRHETVYRDASGRVINVAMKRAEARRAEAEAAKKKVAEADAARGDAQVAMREARRAELEQAKFLTVARGADDVVMNEELRERERWNDPAAKFLSSRPGGGKKTGGGGGGKGGKPVYQGGFQPNRYGLRPGYRWDGVDRSNGFEAKWFAARNKVKDRENLEYAWQMDE